MTTGVLLLLAALTLSSAIALGPRMPRVWLALTVIGTLAILVAALGVLGGAADWEWRSDFYVGDERLHLRLDGLSALFLTLVSVVGGCGAVYAREYWSDRERPDSAPRGHMWWSAILLFMGFLLLCSNGLHFLIAWELFALSAYFLITLDGKLREVRKAGWLYLAASHTGTLCLFAFFSALAARTGSWELGAMREHAELAPLYWLALVGFSVKAGLFPLHVWLPSAHANAPSHVSALMSGVAIKMGVYGLIRFSGWLPVPSLAPWILVAVGAVSALLGIAFAFAQNDFKRLLAYCSVENVGIIAVALGGAMLGAAHADAAWGRLLLAGALLHVWNHGLFKSLLFLGAGSLLHATGTREMSRLGGLWRRMPWTAGLFFLGALAACGLPPLNGFVSEWLVYLGLFDAAASHGVSAWSAMPAAILLATAGALALACFTKAGAVVFLGAPRTHMLERARDSSLWMRGPMIVQAGACVVLGLAPSIAWPALSRAVSAWNPNWSGAEPPAPLYTLSLVQLTFAGLALLVGAWLWRRANANGLRRALTWDGGYAAPTGRMQYTAGSFAAIVTGWFFPIVRRERVQRRVRGPFPAQASRIDRVPESVLEFVVEPSARAVMRAAGVARQLQHGRLQFYIVYLFCGLTLLALLVVLGGSQ